MSFLNANSIEHLRPLARSWRLIRDEYDQIKYNARQWPEPIHNGKWYVIGLRFLGDNLPAQAFAPITTKLCGDIPGAWTFGFSIMQPGCLISPHRGYTKDVLRIHLGLHANGDSAIRVGDEETGWKEGELLMFDDTQVHSAWNRGATERVILLMDVYSSAIVSCLQ
jgi:aspartyl/asparaginyl beta-hydroxylase (cupin superfamily)